MTEEKLYIQYRLDVINEMYFLLQSPDLNIMRRLIWEDEMNFQIRRLQQNGHTVILGTDGYQFADEEQEEQAS